MTTTIWTLGYQGRSLEEFVALLREHDIDTLADVRWTPRSHKRGFNRRILSEALEQASIEYLHVPQVGTPPEIRKQPVPREQMLATYAQYMHPRWEEALPELLARVCERRVALMCFERDPRECHRSLVARALQERIEAQGDGAEVEVVDL